MSLGLEAAGFELYMANELSPMASETFAYNILGEDISLENSSLPKKVLWIRSNFKLEERKERLRENPFTYNKGQNSDLKDLKSLEGKLLVGSIDHLLEHLREDKSLSKDLKNLDIDLISGGPPCQGFSLAGKRIKDDHKNKLPLSFAQFAGIVKPKIVLLENVKGITAPFTDEDGQTYFAWLEVAKAFALEGYIPICMMLNSKYFGVPQNRPRFIYLGIRKDVFETYEKQVEKGELKKILENSRYFYKTVKENKGNLNIITTKDLNLYDIETRKELFDGNLLPKISTDIGSFVSAKQAIDDIKTLNTTYYLKDFKSGYAKSLNKTFPSKIGSKDDSLKNHDHRKHTYLVQARFRLYQILTDLNGYKKDALHVISGKDKSESGIQKTYEIISGYKLFLKNGNEGKLEYINNPDVFKNYISQFNTRKHSQRALIDDDPAPAQLTIPDDVCHYHEEQLRTVTVREMARIQSFPDWFVFRSKVTTGGNQRSFEVPQYTQVGNAVPPLLALALGKTVSNILTKVKNG
ncbi:hypothetical protein SY85_14320 [Flavisolibacter tropicus]|uniref:Cytosine-specific methyltransferase n=2 Tax=Flavisolibacter tropicus TaxID=1492898 RepID=A0A172U3D8_9BACT|nr:hypothetical protein SY85_14320 [Flavisolibacter tropicus]